jgi:glycosyltransferase involved in cell wall biosynthesis
LPSHIQAKNVRTVPKAKIGIYDVSMGAKGGGEKQALVLAEHLARAHNVRLIVERPLDIDALKSCFDVNMRGIEIVVLKKPALLLAAARLFRGTRLEQLGTQLVHFLQIKALKLDVFINNSFSSNLVCPAPRGIYMCMFPHPPAPLYEADGWPRKAYHSFTDRLEKSALSRPIAEAMSSYSIVTVNSRYTGEWVRKLWGRRSKVTYSVCDDMGPPATKEKIILNVGRFTAHGTGTWRKRQEILLDVFKRLTDIHRDGWQLHFAGSVEEDENAALSSLMAKLVDSARGYPVFFHFDADLAALRTLYRKASIYWHATGYGFSVEERPDLQEHFGITTVEAMSAGAVPIVINSGGQREIVTHEVNGFLWDDLAELADQTIRVINDEALLKRLSRQAVLSSGKFSRTAFSAAMNEIVEGLISEAATL